MLVRPNVLSLVVTLSLVTGSLAAGSLVAGCAADLDAPGSAEGAVREPRICPAIAILCAPGYEARRLPNCRWQCRPERDTECRTDADCTIYCITTPCPTGVCERGHCGIADEEPSACAAVLCIEGTHCVEHGGNARCVADDTCGAGMAWDAATGGCVCTSIAMCASGWSWDPVACECVSPCAAVRCAAGTHCVANEDGSASCEPDAGACVRTGCSGEVCADSDVITICEYRPYYACYDTATCERQADGSCGWTETPELDACLAGSI